jgi:hypothetical protein
MARLRSGYLRSRITELARPETRAAAEPLAQWALAKVRLEGKPFSFDGHEYLRAIYDDTGPHVVVSKGAQVGGTTWALLRSIHACAMGLNVIYYFPTRTDVIEFSKSRVGPLLAENAFLGRLMRDTDTAGLKRIGEAHLYFRGMQSSVGLKSVPGDMVVFDELDESPPESKTMARERLAHSDYKRIIELSNPSLPDYGIDEVYQRSDQRHWTVKCPGCGAWTALEKEFPRRAGQEVKIIRPRHDGTFYRACPKCEAELDMSAGEWIADHPGRPIHGYRISQLFSSKVDPGEILDEYRTTRFLDRFYNLKIGIPWADLERRLDVASVLALCSDQSIGPPAKRGGKFREMGVDTGKALHVVILEAGFTGEWPLRIIHLGIYREFAELDELMNTYDVSSCVIDGYPETRSTVEFARRHGRKVFLCSFNTTQRGEPQWDRDARWVAVHRTDALDMSRGAIREAKVVLPREEPIVREFAEHMTCDAKVLDEDEETGAKRYRYVRTGEDHFSLAFTYAWLAAHAHDRYDLRVYGWFGGERPRDAMMDQRF